jgi:ABC-type antimicrobial peptide transport system permease subunit
MDSYGLLRRFIRGFIVFGMVTATHMAGGFGCSATDEPPTWEEALRQDRAQNIKAYGENILTISPGAERLSFGRPTSAALTIQDVQALAKRCPSVVAVAPIVWVRGEVVAFQSRNWTPIYLFGTTKSYLTVRDWTKLKEGQPFSDEDVRDSKAVCLLGQSVANSLFKGASPLGQQIKFKGNSFRVLGVLSAKGRNSLNLDQDDVVLIPWTTAGRLFNAAPQGKLLSIWAKAASSEKMPAAIREMAAVLRAEHHIPQGGQNDFTILDLIKSKEEVKVQAHEAEHGRNK